MIETCDFMQSATVFLHAMQNTELAWIESRKDSRLFDAVFEGEHVQVRLNDFPEEPILTVFFRGQEMDIEESPKKWRLVHND